MPGSGKEWAGNSLVANLSASRYKLWQTLWVSACAHLGVEGDAVEGEAPPRQAHDIEPAQQRLLLGT